jgi:hypothetical protein
MGDPLDQQTPGGGKLVKHSAHAAQVFWADPSQFLMDRHTCVVNFPITNRGAPNMNTFTFGCQTAGYQM